MPSIADLMHACITLTGQRPDIVAIDMPMARSPILRRRFADNAVSKAYGARKCGTHTPNAERPGSISESLTSSFADAGYPLATETIAPPCLIEVYPHPALVELMSAPERLPYKVAKISKYWPTISGAERKVLLLANWSSIVHRIDRQIAGAAERLRLPLVDAPKWELKSAEDLIDAAVCVWVGIAALNGHAQSFGDDDAAIWIPRPLA
jgi:predicted RNase H-like nuclease